MQRYHLVKRLWALLVVAFGAILWSVGQVGAQAPVSLTAKLIPRPEAKEKVAPDPLKLNDMARIEAKADSAGGIVRVVMEINDVFRAELKKPPYVFDWDTLDENDGEHTLTIIAYNNNGQTGTQRLKVKVENRLDLGIPHYAQQAFAALRRFDAVGLAKAARKAYKISTANPEAIRVMALHVGLNQGDTGRAFQLLDDQQSNIPKDDPLTLEVRSVLLLARGFRNPNVQAMLPDLQAGMALAKQRANKMLETLTASAPDDKADAQSLLARGDALTSLNRPEDAITAYDKAAAKAETGATQRRVRQRQVMTLLRLGRMKEAETLAKRLASSSDATHTALATLGAVQYTARKYALASETVKEGAKQGNLASLVVMTLAELALGARATPYKTAREAVETLDCPETQYIAQAALADAGDLEGARKSFILAALNAPLSTPILIERAFEIMAYDKSEDRFIQGMLLLDIALGLEPDNIAATAGKAAALYHLKRYQAAGQQIKRLGRLEPNAPDLFAFLAVEHYRENKSGKPIQDALNRALALDSTFKFRAAPEMPELIPRIMRSRRAPLLTPFLLDRADAPPSPETKTANRN